MAVPDAPVVARLAALLLLVLLHSSCSAAASGDRRTTYIVHMDSTLKPASHSTHEDWYAAQLQSLSADDDTQPRADLLYSYTTAFNGYAASLLPSHVPLLQTNPSVLHIYQDPVLHLHTTRSPEFLGLFRPGTPLTTTAATISAQAADVIVGVLDTGVWPESKSFDDTGMPPVPTRWHGECEAGVDFAPSLCNKKLIGARSFSKGFHAAGDGDPTKPPSNSTAKEYVSPRDRDGHGTHTASTAAGTPVTNASLFGYASGTARGMAPSARVAVYKVCWTSGCFGSDILAAMDRAIDDGVDVLSLSLGGGSSPYFRDTIAVGAFAAASRGVFVSCSAGNSGPRVGSLANTAPWIATVGAGTLDRDFPAYADLGDGVRRVGVSLYSGEGMGSKSAPLIYFPSSSTSGGIGREGRARVIGAGGLGTNSSNLCLPGSLDAAKVKGKVVLCDRGVNARVEKGAVVKSAGGVGMILANTAVNGEELVADSHLLPALAVGSKIGDRIREYARTAANPTALLSFGGTVLDVRPSPVVAAFSSRGPNGVVPQILKPDIIGPGVNILAGWSGSSGPTGLAADSRRTDFNIMSGTSMSCPHISGLAALLKAAHPDWSAAAIKSALMTTAYTVDNTGTPLRDASAGNVATPYAYGSGHVDPQKALNPGLVYDITAEDYISFLCSLRYTPEQIRVITSRSNVSCSHRFKDPGNLNYPSFSVLFDKKAAKRGVKYVRELTNVGATLSTYDVKVEGPANVTLAVKPARLVFRQVGQKLRYTVTFMSKTEGDPRDAAFGWITWSNEQHRVRSPVAYRWSLF